VLDFMRSGAWVGSLVAPAGQRRVVIASCGAGEDSWCEAGGALSFTEWFFCRVFNGVNVRDAFSWARNALRAVTNDRQNSMLDDDGNGLSNRFDGALAMGTYIGAAFVTGADQPTIGDWAKDVHLTSSEALLWASEVYAPAGIKEVYAYVVKPGADAGGGPIVKADLAYNPATGRWEALYADFDLSGPNQVVYYAKDREETLSEPRPTTFSAAPSRVENWSKY